MLWWETVVQKSFKVVVTQTGKEDRRKRLENYNDFKQLRRMWWIIDDTQACNNPWS